MQQKNNITTTKQRKSFFCFILYLTISQRVNRESLSPSFLNFIFKRSITLKTRKWLSRNFRKIQPVTDLEFDDWKKKFSFRFKTTDVQPLTVNCFLVRKTNDTNESILICLQESQSKLILATEIYQKPLSIVHFIFQFHRLRYRVHRVKFFNNIIVEPHRKIFKSLFVRGNIQVEFNDLKVLSLPPITGLDAYNLVALHKKIDPLLAQNYFICYNEMQKRLQLTLFIQPFVVLALYKAPEMRIVLYAEPVKALYDFLAEKERMEIWEAEMQYQMQYQDYIDSGLFQSKRKKGFQNSVLTFILTKREPTSLEFLSHESE